MAKAEHYKKKGERENKTKLLALLRQHNELGFSQLKDMLHVSSPTLSEYIDALEKDNHIEATFSSEDRRIKHYRIKPENMVAVESLLGKYEAIRFIDGISEPVYIYEPPGKKNISVSTFAHVPGKSPKLVETTLKTITKSAASSFNRYVPKLSPGEKVAIVIMMNGGEKAE